MQLAQCNLQRASSIGSFSGPPAMHWEDMRFFLRLGAAHFRQTQEKTSIAKYSRKRAYLIEKNATER